MYTVRCTVENLFPGYYDNLSGADTGNRDRSGAVDESFKDGLLEYPQYTRPREFIGMEVPEVLLSGNHEEIRKWRRKESLKRTILRRPDLMERFQPNEEDKKLMRQIMEDME